MNELTDSRTYRPNLTSYDDSNDEAGRAAHPRCWRLSGGDLDAVAPPSLAELCQHVPQARYRDRQSALHALRLQAQDPIPRTHELTLPTGIRTRAVGMIAAINLDDEAHRRREEIHDEAPKQRHLPAKRDTELAGTQSAPEQLFRVRGSAAHAMRVSGEDELAIAIDQGELLFPARGRTEPHAQEL